MLRLARTALLSLCAIGVLLRCSAAPVHAQGAFVTDRTITQGGIVRYFDYYLPGGLGPGPAPLLIVLHGGTRSNDALQTTPLVEFRNVADSMGVIVLYPNGTSPETGTSGPDGKFNWNDCRSDAAAATTTANDVAFMNALIDWAAASFEIDLNRVYAAGVSNGGLMAFRLAFELSDRIAAVAAVVANQPGNSECAAQPANPVPVLIMNGTDDVFMPWAGGQIITGRGLILSALETRDLWQSFLGTDPVPVHTDVPDLDPNDGGRVTIDTYGSGADGSELRFYAVGGGGHSIPSIAHPMSAAAENLFGKQNHDVEAAVEIMAFFDGRVLGDTGRRHCSWSPRSGCRRPTVPLKSKLTIKDRKSSGTRIAWHWSKGEATSNLDFGDPLLTTDYSLCAYDESGVTPTLILRARVPAGGTCSGKPCWKEQGNSGFRYRDKAASADGVHRIKLRSGSDGKARIQAKMESVPSSARPFGLPTLPVRLPLRVQLQSDVRCWEAVFLGDKVGRNDGSQFTARGD